MSEITMNNPRDSVELGVGAAVSFHLLQLLVVFGAPFVHHPGDDLDLTDLVLACSAWGATQFLYLGPLVWWFWRRGQKQRMKGVLIVAGIGVLLNGACDALVLLPGRF